MVLFGRKSKDLSKAERAIFALQELQQTLHLLNPLEKSEVKAAMPFASAEWLDGLALACRPKANEGSVHVMSRDVSNAIESKALLRKEAAAQDDARKRLTPDSGKLVLVLVGLPARGKSLLGHKLENFLTWRGYKTKGFRVGGRRRQMSEETDQRPETGSASFFDSSKAYAAMVREKLSIDAFDEALDWLVGGGEVAIFDASNVSIQRRAKLKERVNERMAAGDQASADQIGIVFIESIVTDPVVIQQGMEWKATHSPDFKGLEASVALKDLQDRIDHYEKTYETVREEEGPYIKMFNLRAKAHACNIYGRMSKSVLPYLLAIHSLPRPVYMLIVEEEASSWFDLAGTSKVEQWAATLRSTDSSDALRILTSTQDRAIATAVAVSKAAQCPEPAERAQLTPLSRGSGTATNTRRSDESDANKPEAQSFAATFGERIKNLVSRLEPIALEIEAATSPILIVAPESHIRVLRSFLLPPTETSLLQREQVDASVQARPNRLFVFSPKPTGGYEESAQEL